MAKAENKYAKLFTSIQVGFVAPRSLPRVTRGRGNVEKWALKKKKGKKRKKERKKRDPLKISFAVPRVPSDNRIIRGSTHWLVSLQRSCTRIFESRLFICAQQFADSEQGNKRVKNNFVVRFDLFFFSHPFLFLFSFFLLFLWFTTWKIVRLVPLIYIYIYM